jgi:hypothetical protein
LCLSVEYTAFSVDSVAQINNNLVSIVHSVRCEINIYMYFIWRLSFHISQFDLQYTYIILSLLPACLHTTCTKRETRSPRTEMQQMESGICTVESPLSVRKLWTAWSTNWRRDICAGMQEKAGEVNSTGLM